MSDQVYEVEFRGKDTSFASVAREATKAVGDLRGAGIQLISSFSGGLLGGGIADTVLKTVEKIRDVIREAKELANDAQKRDLDKTTLRGFRTTSEALGLDKNALENATESTRQAVAEALKGRPEAKRNFAALGIETAGLDKLAPEELLYKVFGAAGRGPATDARRFALRGILGQGAGDLEPYAFGGTSRLDLAGAVRNLGGLSGDSLLRAAQVNSSTLYETSGAVRAGTDTLRDIGSAGARAKYRADLGPFSGFGLENEDSARRLRIANNEEEAKQLRERLPIQQQITEAVKRQAQLNREIDSTVDPAARERLRSRSLSIGGEIAALRDKQVADLAKGAAAPGGVVFHSGGGISVGAGLASGSARPSFGAGPGGDQSAVIALLTAQLTTAKQQLASLGALPAALAREL